MEERNQRPEDASKLPIITLVFLLGLIFALLFVGYEYFSDGPDASRNDLINQNIEKADKIGESEKSEVAEKVIEKPKVEKDEAEPLPKKVEEVETEIVKTETPKVEAKVTIPTGGQTISHTVQDGETFYGIANRYNLKPDVLKALNPDLNTQTLKVGVSKIKVNINTKHTVGPGDILSVVAKKYGITKKELMNANKLTKDFSKRGDELIIPNKK